MDGYDIILKPLLSEKSYDGIPDKKYTFVVDTRANKTQIKRAVEEIFKVKVEKVNTLNVRGKLKKQGKTQGYTPKSKKAIVRLTADSKAIEFFESLA
jgi:large subunit ribosomal protein L23